ncbi:hypothetical protein [Micromonospora chersina]|uniref:hypothetical protein n=1 Tax=Micromonospora chersina TaxID=47854 RepID=UPI0033B1DAA4
MDVLGLDVSDAAVHQLAQRRPDRADRLWHGDLDSLPAGDTWPLVIGIQVFQHGNREQAHRHVRGRTAASRTWGPVVCAGQRHRHGRVAGTRSHGAAPGRRIHRAVHRRTEERPEHPLLQ